jgi:hypothetical protein
MYGLKPGPFKLKTTSDPSPSFAALRWLMMTKRGRLLCVLDVAIAFDYAANDVKFFFGAIE